MKKILSPLILLIFFIIRVLIIPKAIEFESELISISTIAIKEVVLKREFIILASVLLLFIGSTFIFGFSTLQRILLWVIIGAIISPYLLGEMVIIIKSVKWIPKIELSTLTAIISGVIIMLSLIREERKFNE